MAREGIGITRLACVLDDTDRKLRRVPARYVESGPSLWVLSHVDLRTTARVGIFRDFLVKALEALSAIHHSSTQTFQSIATDHFEKYRKPKGTSSNVMRHNRQTREEHHCFSRVAPAYSRSRQTALPDLHAASKADGLVHH